MPPNVSGESTLGGYSDTIKGHAEATPTIQCPASIHLRELGEYYGMRRFHLILIMLAIMLELSCASVFNTFPYVIEDVCAHFNVGYNVGALIVTAVVIGSIPGVILGGILADKFGRRETMLALATIMCLGNVLHLMVPERGAQNWGPPFVIMLRIGLGIPYGGLLTTIIPYVTELVPDNIRGFATSSLALAWPIGSMYCVGLRQATRHMCDWQTYVAIAPLLPFTISMTILTWAPESPRWLLVQGQKRLAQRALDQVFSSPPLLGSCHVGRAPMVLWGTSSPIDAQHFRYGAEYLRQLFSPGLRQVTLVSCVLYTILAGAANTGYMWGPTILERISGFPAPLWVFQLSSLVAILANVLAMVTIDLAGRRALLSSCYFLGALALGLMYVHPSPGVCSFFWTTKSFADAILWVTLGTYMSEAFPTEVRATAYGFACLWGRLASVVLPIGAGALLAYSPRETVVGLHILYVAGVCFMMMIRKETARRAIDDKCMEGFGGERQRFNPTKKLSYDGKHEP